jgi:two-component system chemotaxis sensor kinase CheA
MADEMEEIIAEFITESEETLDRVDPLFVELEQKGEDKEILNKIFRSVHTIKGAAGFLGFQPVVDVAHNAENIMKRLRDGDIRLSKRLMDAVLQAVDLLRLLLRHVKQKDGVVENTGPVLAELKAALESAGAAGAALPGATQAAAPQAAPVAAAATPAGPAVPAADATSAAAAAATSAVAPTASDKEALQTLRVDVGKIDKVMDLTGEVVLVRNRLLNIVNRLEQSYSDDHNVQSLLEAVSFLDLITSDMQLGVMKMRMQPIQKVFSRFPRVVRDVSSALGKNVDLKVSGEDTEVDKSVIEEIGDPMVHIIRNAIDHGLETPKERTAAGKPERGTISISAAQKGTQIIIEVTDDGRGINIDKVKRKAVERKLVSEDEASRMTDEAAINLLFLPGFSTADVATELSGRGVGMDVVKTNISKLNGTVEVTTSRGMGSTFLIRIPLTLAIIQTLMVRAGGQRYAVPLAPVEETLMVSKDDISDLSGSDALIIRDRIYPLFRLVDILSNGGTGKSAFKYAVVVSIGERRFCIGVDELLGQEEVVIKTMAGMNGGSSHLLGATITGDGKVVFIIDLASLSRQALGVVAA